MELKIRFPPFSTSYFCTVPLFSKIGVGGAPHSHPQPLPNRQICKVVLWVVCTHFFVLCVVKSGKCTINGIPTQPGHSEFWRKALFNTRTNPQLYKRPDVEIKEIDVNLYLQVYRAANNLGLREKSKNLPYDAYSVVLTAKFTVKEPSMNSCA